jgi:predicted nucleic acid-binding protein
MSLSEGPPPAWPANERCFFDSNILVYTDDGDAPAKQIVAIELVEHHRHAGTGVISTQVLQEYYVNATRKMRVAPEVAQRKVEIYAHMPVVPLDVPTILAAIDLHRLHQISFWDALIVQAAKAGGCTVLLSEDMHDGASLRGIRVVNPFAGIG